MAKTALVVASDGTQSTLDVETEFLSKMQTAVDGLIQPIDISDTITMWVNEEFLFRNSFEPNLLGTAMYQSIGGDGVIMGTIVFTGGTDSDGNTLGLSMKEFLEIQRLATLAQVWSATGTMV